MSPEGYAQAIVTAGDRLAAATDLEMTLEDTRPAAKQLAVLRIVGTVNPATGKAHSASSAEAVVETDEEYAAYRARQRAAVVERIKARAYYEASIARARLATPAPAEV